MRNLAILLLLFSATAAEAKPHCYRAGVLGLPAPLEGAVIKETDAGVTAIFGGDTRYQSVMEIRLTPEASTEDFQSLSELDDGLVLAYSSVVEEAVGSGGPEAGLTGQVLHDGKVLARIGCSTQAENSPNAEWCLPYLKTLVLADQHCNLDGEE